MRKQRSRKKKTHLLEVLSVELSSGLDDRDTGVGDNAGDLALSLLDLLEDLLDTGSVSDVALVSLDVSGPLVGELLGDVLGVLSGVVDDLFERRRSGGEKDEGEGGETYGNGSVGLGESLSDTETETTVTAVGGKGTKVSLRQRILRGEEKKGEKTTNAPSNDDDLLREVDGEALWIVQRVGG
jgi:hypothetical protein